MKELKSSGNPFTWGGRRGKHWIQCKLDRCFANKRWEELFPMANQTFLEKRGSDHRPVLVSLLLNASAYKGRFRFDKKILGLPNIKEKIAIAWRESDVGISCNVTERIRRCRRAISRWKRATDLNAKEKITRFQEDLELEQSSSFPCRQRVTSIKMELMKANREEESFWREKSKDKWLKLGDKNSRFFHDSVNASRSRNGIDLLEDVNGVEHRDEKAKGEIAVAYFQNLFTSSNPNDFAEIFEDFQPRVTEAMNDDLIKPVSDEDIEEAVFSIKSSSAPGPDGMSGLFFQKFWKEIGAQVKEEIKEFFQTGILPSEWNHTHLCLIPKVIKASKMSNLRPISLCSVLYKIVSKIMVKRMQHLLPLLVSPFQSAFVPERQISDNILIAHEAVHSLRTFNPIASEFMAVKSDMSKAYDRVEWAYVKRLLMALGFHQRWIKLVMACISSVTFSVLINDQPFGFIIPERGLRQGDPLSPSLFVLCTEGLSHLLMKAESAGLFNGIGFSDAGPSICHLLFADDSLFMCKASVEQARILKSILHIYGEATGQVINLEKSSITFGKGVLEEGRKEIQDLLGIYNEGGASAYLGLPECFSGSKVEMLNYINEKLKSRLSGWFARSLSLGGKEVLLKAVALALPVYAMGCFKLPKTTIEKLTSAMAGFWWDSLENKRKIHWMKWGKLCLPKDLGGLGFKDLESFNQALLAKQAWKLIQNPNCLLARFLKSSYYEGVDFMEASIGSRPSFGWRSVLFGRELIMKGCRKEIGNGKSLRVWLDPWCDFGNRKVPWMMNPLINLELRVSDLIDQRSGNWNVNSLEENFFPVDVSEIIKIKPIVECEDFLCWMHNKSGDYSVKSGYWLASQSFLKEEISSASMQPSANCLKEKAWEALTEPKIKAFMWRALSDAISIPSNLVQRGMKLDQRCQSCGVEGESGNHVLFTCDVARQLWAMTDFPCPENGFHPTSLFVNMYFVFQMSKNIKIPLEIRRMYPWVLWWLWKNRNKFLFEGKKFDILETRDKIRDEANIWFAAQQMERSNTIREVEDEVRVKRWDKPKENWKKCNIGVCWSKSKNIAGCGWVLRDHFGVVLLHSRRQFSEVNDLQEAKMKCLCWAFECMAHHRIAHVVLAAEEKNFLNALQRPKTWPSFKMQVLILKNALTGVFDWKTTVESRLTNRGAFLVAKSATLPQFAQSYVARGAPGWLSSVFDNEKRVTSI